MKIPLSKFQKWKTGWEEQGTRGFALCTVFLLVVMSGGCINSFDKSATNGEGMITYKILYTNTSNISHLTPASRSQTANIHLLPGETNLVFKDAKASFITSVMGMVQIVNLLDNDKKKFTTLLINSVGENYAFTDTPEDVKEQETNPEYEIETTGQKKTIAGLLCNKAIVSDITNNNKFDIYYYPKIKVYLGNSPYKDFNFLLMEYRDTRYELKMHLQATKVDFTPVDTTMLEVHGDYNWVDRKTFFSILVNLKTPI